MNPEDAIVEARARIIWGEAPSSVHYFLTSSGISAAEAHARIKQFNAERNSEIRRIGFRRALIGAVIICIAGICFYFTFQHTSTLFPSKRVRNMFGEALAGLCGVWMLVHGVFYILRPKSEHRSLPDISE
jgi:hypothetical protein